LSEILTDHIGLEREKIRRRGFSEFAKRAWDKVDRNALVWNWHISEMCQALEEVARARYEGVGKELVICVPPASTKSRIASVLWQPWIWTWWPEFCFLSATYEGGPGSVALKHSTLSRNLVQSRWYQDRWPTELIKEGESYWSNAEGGVREAVGTGMAVTGDHYHGHLGDDLVPEQLSRVGTYEAISKSLEKAKGFWWSTLSTREKDLGKTARVLIGQRLHVEDPPGEAIKRGYESIVFPAHFNPAKADPRDHRTEEGELLCKERADETYYQKKAIELGPSGASAQLEQEPIPPGGQLITEDCLKNRYEQLPGRLLRTIETGKVGQGQKWVIYIDTTSKSKKQSKNPRGPDFVAIQLWCKYEGEPWLIDQDRGQWGFKQTKQHIRDFSAKYPFVITIKLEDAANAPSLQDDLEGEFPGLILEPHSGGCMVRTQLVEGVWKSGNVHLPARAPWMGGGDGFVAEHLAFDGLGLRHDDQVSCSSLALVDLAHKSKRSWAEKLKGAKIWND